MLAFGPIMGIPTSFIVSPEGDLIETHVGIITYADLDFHINPPIHPPTYETKTTQK